jgi:hypothetical protein
MLEFFKTGIRVLSSPKLTTTCLLILAVLVFWGTIFQASHGLYEAQQRFFGAWIVLIGGWLPFPGVKLVGLVCVCNLLASMLFRIRRRPANAGLFVIHAGVIILLIGGAYGHHVSRESALELAEGQSSAMAHDDQGNPAPLPVTITLLDFEKKFHPGSSIPLSFQSRVHITGPNVDRDAVIAMNRPLRWRDYAFYQSSYADAPEGRESSTLAVVKNPARMVPSIAGIIAGMGLLLHFVIKLVSGLQRRRP